MQLNNQIDILGNMQIVLLSGGSGKRLWPLSNNARSKQFLPLLDKEDGSMESMVQRVVRQVREADLTDNITLATNASQLDIIINQLGESVSVVTEPERRDTFPAIALAASYLKLAKNCPDDEVVVIMPCDPFTEAGYFATIGKMAVCVERNVADLVLMGITPTYPSEKYGYVVPETDSRNAEGSMKVRQFTEKPNVERAKQLLSIGALWNGGVFAFRLGYMMDIVRKYIKSDSFEDTRARYCEFPKISFDYEVAEKAQSVAVVPYTGQWKDLGTWNTLTEAMEEHVIGKGVLNETCTGVHILNEMDVPVLAMGLHDVVISASPEGILVSDKEQSSYIKPFVDEFEQQIMFAEKSWGSYKVIDVEEESLTIKVTLNPGHSMNYHSHRNRDEVWVVLSGTGKAILDDREQAVKVGDVITMKAGCRHTVIAESELKLVEVQIGEDINVRDKQKFELLR